MTSITSLPVFTASSLTASPESWTLLPTHSSALNSLSDSMIWTTSVLLDVITLASSCSVFKCSTTLTSTSSSRKNALSSSTTGSLKNSKSTLPKSLMLRTSGPEVVTSDLQLRLSSAVSKSVTWSSCNTRLSTTVPTKNSILRLSMSVLVLKEFHGPLTDQLLPTKTPSPTCSNTSAANSMLKSMRTSGRNSDHTPACWTSMSLKTLTRLGSSLLRRSESALRSSRRLF
mmetsp:Transcript_82254/g.96215  ORF Transcript_82254/g.96215 Transcript_82254/m.96215 type:complete len:229 (+) Transcript_82254:510-1196(+)